MKMNCCSFRIDLCHDPTLFLSTPMFERVGDAKNNPIAITPPKEMQTPLKHQLHMPPPSQKVFLKEGSNP